MQITQQFSKLTKAKSLYFTNWHQGSGFKKKKILQNENYTVILKTQKGSVQFHKFSKSN